MTDRRSMLPSLVEFVLVLGLAVAGLGVSARAQDSPPTTRAARLTYLQGTVTVDQADNTAGVPAQLNLPLLAGVRLATGADGQAEVEFEDGSVVRLTPNSVLSLDKLAVEPAATGETVGAFTTGLSLLQGLAYLELRATPQYRYTLDAGGDVLSPVENTTVRVSFDEPPAIFAVLDGAARVERQSGAGGGGPEREVRAGESLRGDPGGAAAYSITPEITEDSWDQWNEDRDQSAVSEAGARTAVRDNYAGAQGYGWSDLDANGSWYDVPGQGPIWQPQLALADASFDPYGNGAWAWYPGTGYLWASGYSWGWTPYRCGSWSYFNSFGWGWAPGAGCGGFGWGFIGGGHPVNIGLFPRGYRPIRVPIAGQGPVRPLLPVRATTAVQPAQPVQRSVASTVVQAGPRRIGGVTVEPIEPVGSGFTARSGTVGSSLRRDFPIDSSTHLPVAGLTSTQPAVVHSASGWHSTGERPIPEHPAYTGQSHPASGPYYYPAPVVRAAPYYGQSPRPVQQTAPVQHSSPTPPAHPASAPASGGTGGHR